MAPGAPSVTGFNDDCPQTAVQVHDAHSLQAYSRKPWASMSYPDSVRTRPWQSLLLLAASTAFSLAALEGAVRVLPFARAPQFDLRWAIRPDSRLGWQNIPGASKRYASGEYAHDVTYNSHGIRGPERGYDKPAGARRIVMLGDSYVDGFSVPRESRVSDVLETQLNGASPGSRTEVLALGVSGYSTDQQLLWLDDEGWRYQPDLVILMFFENDVWFNGEATLGERGKPRFVEEGGALTLSPTLEPLRAELPPPQPTGAAGVEAWLASQSKAYALSKATLQMYPGLRRLGVRLGLRSPVDEMWAAKARMQGELQVYARAPSADVEARWQLTQALLREMGRESRTRGVRFLAFLIPARISVDRDEWNAVRSAMRLSSDDWDPSVVASRFSAMCQAESLECIEPTARFTEVQRGLAAGTALYYKTDGHWNASGHHVAAEILAEWIRDTAPEVGGAK